MSRIISLLNRAHRSCEMAGTCKILYITLLTPARYRSQSHPVGFSRWSKQRLCSLSLETHQAQAGPVPPLGGTASHALWLAAPSVLHAGGGGGIGGGGGGAGLLGPWMKIATMLPFCRNSSCVSVPTILALHVLAIERSRDFALNTLSSSNVQRVVWQRTIIVVDREGTCTASCTT